MFPVEGKNKKGVSREPSALRLFAAPTGFSRSHSETEVIQLSFQCENLPNCDLFSLSDPFLLVYELSSSSQPVFILQTETVWNSLSPKFVKAAEMAYSDFIDPLLHVKVLDRDAKSDVEDKHDFLGECTFRVRELMSAENLHLKVKLVEEKAKKQNYAYIHILAKRLKDPDDIRVVKFHLTATELKRKGLLSKQVMAAPLVFVQISQERKDTSELFQWDPVYRSEVVQKADKDKIDKDKKYHFDPIEIKMQSLCDSDPRTMFRFELYVFVNSGDHELYGYSAVNLDILEGMHRNRLLERSIDGEYSDLDKLGRLKVEYGSASPHEFLYQLVLDLFGNKSYKPA